MVDMPAHIRIRLDRLDGAVHALLQLFARLTVLIFPGKDFRIPDHHPQEDNEHPVCRLRLAADETSHIFVKLLIALTRALSIDAFGFASCNAELAETSRRSVVPW